MEILHRPARAGCCARPSWVFGAGLLRGRLPRSRRRCYDATDCPYGSRCTASRFCSAAPDIFRPGGHHEAGADAADAADATEARANDADGDDGADQSVEGATSDAPADADAATGDVADALPFDGSEGSAGDGATLFEGAAADSTFDAAADSGVDAASE